MAAEITRESNRVGSLLASTNRVEAPFVRVSIGGYSFGVYENRVKTSRTSNGVVTTSASKFPNYVQNLQVDKINGIVNQYTLQIKYPITQDNDPNFFDKLLSSASDTRKIYFEYGDSMIPEFNYKDEEAIITEVNSAVDIMNANISYNVKAVSTSSLTLSGTYTFKTRTAKPSDVIKEVLYSSKYHLTDVFIGMRNRSNVEQSNFIASDDKTITIPTCTNVSVLEYISILVSYMTPVGTTDNTSLTSASYSLATFEDTSGLIGGPYFKVQRIARSSSTLNQLCVYDIDVGTPTANVITRFDIADNANWMLCLDYNESLGNSDYVVKINSNGELEKVHSPLLKNTSFYTKQSDLTWWKKATQYPISITLTIKGLLKPAILMQYVKLNTWFYGHKHSSSGYYIITSQSDNIGVSGYSTTLKLLRVGSDEEII